jgi:hypothetical protein
VINLGNAIGVQEGVSEEEDFSEESGSHQRLLAALIDGRELPIEPDPVLHEPGDELLERRLFGF